MCDTMNLSPDLQETATEATVTTPSPVQISSKTALTHLNELKITLSSALQKLGFDAGDVSIDTSKRKLVFGSLVLILSYEAKLTRLLVHPFGAVNFAELKSIISSKIDSIRKVAHAYNHLAKKYSNEPSVLNRYLHLQKV